MADIFSFSMLLIVRMCSRCKHQRSKNVTYGEFRFPNRCILRDARGTAYHITVVPRVNNVHIRNNFLDQFSIELQLPIYSENS